MTSPWFWKMELLLALGWGFLAVVNMPGRPVFAALYAILAVIAVVLAIITRRRQRAGTSSVAPPG